MPGTPPPKPTRRLPSRLYQSSGDEPLTNLTIDFDPDEPPTPLKSVKLIRYQKLLAYLDSLPDRRADDLTEIACLFADCTDDEREVMLRVCRAVPRP